jgi:uncharacterized membrane protein
MYKLGNIRGIKFVFCHRRPNRTLRFRGRYFPVCARCTGIYIGALFILLSHYFISLIYGKDIWVYNTDLFFVPLILMIPTAIDGLTQLLKWRESHNWIRVITGLFCGIGYGFILIYW